MNNKFSFYLNRIAGFTLLLVLAAVFLFSGISKLYAFEQLLWNIMDVGVSNMLFAGVIARMFIAFELLLGVFLLFHLFLRDFTYPVIIGLLVFFSTYLVFLISTQGDGGNCGCFGDAYEMKPSAGIIKNMILIGITALLWVIYPIKPYNNSGWIAGILGMAALVIPFVFFPLSGDNEPEIANEPINLSALYQNNPLPSVDLQKGKHIIAFMSLTCPHCKKAAFLFHVIKKQNPELPIFLVLHGKDEFKQAFFTDTKAQNVPYFFFSNTEAFINYARDGVPAIYFVNNSVIERKANYYQLDPENIRQWLSK